jgi:hypothetical protein
VLRECEEFNSTLVVDNRKSLQQSRINLRKSLQQSRCHIPSECRMNAHGIDIETPAPGGKDSQQILPERRILQAWHTPLPKKPETHPPVLAHRFRQYFWDQYLDIIAVDV